MSFYVCFGLFYFLYQLLYSKLAWRCIEPLRLIERRAIYGGWLANAEVLGGLLFLLWVFL